MVASEEIVEHLSSRGFDCKTLDFNGIGAIAVSLEIAGKQIELIHIPEPKITRLPVFILTNPSDVGHLAHVLNDKNDGVEFGSICVNDRDSVSVNFNMPLLAIEESLNRHIATLEKAITDPDWNRKELLREFKSCWLNVCDFDERPVLLTNDSGALEEIDVYKPVNNFKFGVRSYYLAQSKDTDLAAAAKVYWQDSSRNLAGKALVLPLTEIEPAPLQKEQITVWYLAVLLKQEPDLLKKLNENYGRWKTHEYWIVFNAQVPSGKVWFCLYFKSKKGKKHSLPLTEAQLKHWKVKAVSIRLFNKEAVLPRGGANLDLVTSKVALIGAGSVGSEIAHKLSAAGIQDLTIYDDDVYTVDNLYRHILPEEFLGLKKSDSLSFQLKRQFLWSKASSYSTKKLLDLRNSQLLNSYDLIVIAIGSPTHERLFKEYLLEKGIKVPVINTWLEGFGVGGHAVLDMPDSAGCLLCAYVCPDTLTRGLSSNLNFIEPNQDVTINMSGCGEQFISYSAICSAQTALIASDLAIKCLEGKITASSKVSWKGSEHDAKDHGITLTNRFYQFNDSLQVKPLIHEDCDVCN
jgi:hypothetical protein